MLSSIANIVHKLPHESPNNLRLRILGNKQTLGKSQIWDDKQSSAQSPFQKLNYGNSSLKTPKSRYQTFLELSSFPGFNYFVPNILPSIVWENKFLVLTRSSLLQTLIFLGFVYNQSISPIFMENMRQVSCVKFRNYNDFV